MTKAAILIDGGYFLKRLPTVQPDIDSGNPEDVAEAVGQRLFQAAARAGGGRRGGAV